MIKYENECCDCATEGYPCLGSDCPNRHVLHCYCDKCGFETRLYEFDDRQLCEDCLLEEFTVVEGSE